MPESSIISSTGLNSFGNKSDIEAIKIISVFGAGTVGHGIAQIMAQQGYKVLLEDVRQELLDAALDRVKRSL